MVMSQIGNLLNWEGPTGTDLQKLYNVPSLGPMVGLQIGKASNSYCQGIYVNWSRVQPVKVVRCSVIR